MRLTVELAKPRMTTMTDGKGFTLHTAYDGHRVQLSIGNVSVAFDGRNVFEPTGCMFAGGDVYQFGNYADDPVRLFNTPVAGESCAEKLLMALAVDLGYSVSRNEEAV